MAFPSLHTAPEVKGLGFGDWPDIPDPIIATPSPQSPYPEDTFPPDLKDVLQAAQRLAQCPVAITGAALLGALALLAQHDFRVETLAPHPSPPSLFLVALAESGLHKTTAFTLLGSGHKKADSRLATRWNEAKASYDERRTSNKVKEGSGCEPESRSPRLSTPVALLQDFTTDGLLLQLQEGRPSVAMWTPEAGIQINHSFSQNQVVRTLSYLNTAWDGGDIFKVRAGKGNRVYIPSDTYSVSIVWAVQVDIALPLLFSPLALNGLLARCLISRDDTSPSPGESTDRDEDLVRGFNGQVLRVRERQDCGVEYAAKVHGLRMQRPTIELTHDAREQLAAFYGRQRSLASCLRARGQRHETTFAERAPEQAARLAGVFTAWDNYGQEGPVREAPHTDAANVARAIRLVEWHQGEIARLAAVSGTTPKAQYAMQLAKVIAQVVSDPASTHGRYPLINEKGLAIHTLANRRGHPVVRGDTDIRRAVIKILIHHGYIRPGGAKGRYMVHPRLAEAV